MRIFRRGAVALTLSFSFLLAPTFPGSMPVAGLFATEANADGLPATEDAKPDLSTQKLTRIETHLSASVAAGERAGYVAMVAHKGRIAYTLATGMRDIERGIAMTLDTRFRIASMTKPITSLAVMMLVEEGKLGLEDALSDYLPEFTDLTVAASTAFGEDGIIASRPTKRQITIHHLLTHTSGLGYVLDPNTDLGRTFQKANIHFGPESLEEMTQALATHPLYFEPGAKWQYSFATDVLGRLVEVVSGQSFQSFVEESILDPLGMDDTDFIIGQSYAAGKGERLAVVYRFLEDGSMRATTESDVSLAGTDSLHNEEILRWPSGGAGLISTASDYMRFLLMMANGGEIDGTRLVSAATIDRMTRNNVAAEAVAGSFLGDPAAIGFGLGFSVVVDSTLLETVTSDGEYRWGGYFGTNFFVAPGADDLIGILLAQRVPGPNDPIGQGRSAFNALVYGAVAD